MLRGSRDEQVEVEGPRKDVELTFGPAMLFAIACGLLLVCGLCFGVGYTAGRRNGSQIVAAKAAASGQTLAEQASSSLHKPAPTVAPSAAPPASSVNPEPGAAPFPAQTAADGSNTQASAPVVRPAMPTNGAQTNPATASTAQVEPALPPGAGIMVQIAAVSHVEDANVLMNALRKHGYAVTARREADDNMIHVQVGPFASRADANAMSQRLLSDGYNAVVLP